MRKYTESLCPECLRRINAVIHDRDGNVFLSKTCPEHGLFEEIYWSSLEQYERAESYRFHAGESEQPTVAEHGNCPRDCGLCENHRSRTLLAIIDVTNQCNLRCPVCFAHAGARKYLYEPNLEEVRRTLRRLRSTEPVPPPAIQFSGGEPTVREDLPKLVRMAHEYGFSHVEVNSNGLRMAESLGYCRELREAGLSTVYLQFDGVTPEPYKVARGFDLLPIKKRALENLRAAGIGVVLVPVLIRGLNDAQVGDIIKFAVENRDVVRCVNFQPVSFTGRIDASMRARMRITIPDLMRFAEEQTGGLIKEADWYPVPTPAPLAQFIGRLEGTPQVEFSGHPHCGMATYLVIEGGTVKPITSYLDVDGLLHSVKQANEKLAKGEKTRAKIEAISGVMKNVKLSGFKKHLLSLLEEGSLESLGKLHDSMVMVGAMHFMDPYNFDLNRVRDCVVHYALPDGRSIPFCSMNALHRESVEKELSKPLLPGEMVPLADVEALKARISAGLPS